MVNASWDVLFDAWSRYKINYNKILLHTIIITEHKYEDFTKCDTMGDFTAK